MPGEVINESILIIASVIMIGALAGSVYVGIAYAGSALSSSSLQGSQKLLTDVQIDYATNLTSTQIAVYVQNTGSAPINFFHSSTVYFGVQNSQMPIGYGGPAPFWNSSATLLNPGSTAQVNITAAQALQKNAYYTVMYITPNGISATYTFEVA